VSSGSDLRRLARGAVPDLCLARRVQPLAPADLRRGLDTLGLAPGGPIMVHASLRALGWLAGGVDALIAVLAERGTLTAQVGWEDNRWHMYSGRLPHAWTRAYLDGTPAFDPQVSQAAQYEGRFAERLRTWPGACRSAHPHVGIAAVGTDAEWLTAEHPLDGGFGPRSPYARIARAGGRVLLLGAPLTTITILHRAEAIARVPHKRRISYRVPMAIEGTRRWMRIDDLDLHQGSLPYERIKGLQGVHPFARIAAEALAAGIGARAPIGSAECHAFPAAPLVQFAVDWMERELAGPLVGHVHSSG
jgi:aminoglycoside 3-N-acetyltransferase